MLAPADDSPGRRIDRNPRLLLAVLVGGSIGTVLRAMVGEALPHDPATWPWATFLVNIAGAGLLGLIATLLLMPSPPRTPRSPRESPASPVLGQPAASPLLGPLLTTGLCGGLTTFSTLQVEVFGLLDAGRAGLAIGYLALSCGAGLLAIWATSTAVLRRRPAA